MGGIFIASLLATTYAVKSGECLHIRRHFFNMVHDDPF